MRATSFDANAKRTASFWESLSVGSKNSTFPEPLSGSSRFTGSGVGDSMPKSTRISVEWSASCIFCIRSIVQFILYSRDQSCSSKQGLPNIQMLYVPFISNLIRKLDPAKPTNQQTILNSPPLHNLPPSTFPPSLPLRLPLTPLPTANPATKEEAKLTPKPSPPPNSPPPPLPSQAPPAPLLPSPQLSPQPRPPPSPLVPSSRPSSLPPSAAAQRVLHPQLESHAPVPHLHHFLLPLHFHFHFHRHLCLPAQKLQR